MRKFQGTLRRTGSFGWRAKVRVALTIGLALGIGLVASSARAASLANLAGNYSLVGQGVTTLCYTPDYSDLESCSTGGVATLQFNAVSVGNYVQDVHGNFCVTETTVLGLANYPYQIPPFTDTYVGNVTDYNPVTGTGDIAYTQYSGGACFGTEWNATGATLVGSGTSHFVASSNGTRVDSINTTSTQPSQGSFAGTTVSLRQ